MEDAVLKKGGVPKPLPRSRRKTRKPRVKHPKDILKKKRLWILAAALLIGLASVGAGAHVGAHGEGRWYTRGVLWLAEALSSPPAQRGPGDSNG